MLVQDVIKEKGKASLKAFLKQQGATVTVHSSVGVLLKLLTFRGTEAFQKLYTYNAAKVTDFKAGSLYSRALHLTT